MTTILEYRNPLSRPLKKVLFLVSAAGFETHRQTVSFIGPGQSVRIFASIKEKQGAAQESQRKIMVVAKVQSSDLAEADAADTLQVAPSRFSFE